MHVDQGRHQEASRSLDDGGAGRGQPVGHRAQPLDPSITNQYV